MTGNHGVEGEGVSRGHAVEHAAGEIGAAAFGVEVEKRSVEEERDVAGEGESVSLDDVSVEGEAEGKGGEGRGGGEVGTSGQEGEDGDVVGVGVGSGEHEGEGGEGIGEETAAGMASDGGRPGDDAVEIVPSSRRGT